MSKRDEAIRVAEEAKAIFDVADRSVSAPGEYSPPFAG